MAHTLLPTTKAQVSGHKFLKRRVEHGLIMGDIRMLHDPVASRGRALVFGLVAVVLLALGSGVLAWMRPNPDPGNAAIVRAQDGQLLVLVDDTYHPAANLVSARLIAGEPANPVSIGKENLANATMGSPLGIPGAPLAAPAESDGEVPNWAACVEPRPQQEAGRSRFITTVDEVGQSLPQAIVLSNAHPRAFPANTLALVRSAGRLWVFTPQGRIAVPEEMGARLTRENVPVWRVPAEVVHAVKELPQTHLADVNRQLAAASWLEHFAEQPPVFDGQEPGEWLCVNAQGQPVVHDRIRGLVEVSSSDGAAASYYSSENSRTIAVDAGGSLAVVSASGHRHPVANHEVLSVLGFDAAQQAPWPILSLLPQGVELSEKEALKPLL